MSKAFASADKPSFHPIIDNYLGLESDLEKISNFDAVTPPKIVSDLGDYSLSKGKATDIPQSNYLSPTKAGFAWGGPTNRSPQMQSDLSPMSSNVSSFYYDRIEELLPEKKMIAEKLYKKDLPTFASMVEEGIETPQKDLDFQQRSKVPFRNHFSKSRYLSDFQKLKEELKYRLSFKSKEEFEKDKHKKEAASGLKFMRKLGGKLRRKTSVRRDIVSNIRREAQQISESPAKSVKTMDSSETKISPRIALMKLQQEWLLESKDKNDGASHF